MEKTDTIIKSAMYPPKFERDFKEVGNTAFIAARELQPDFVVDDILKSVMRALALYFANDPRFEEEGNGKLEKGIFLSGNVGTGKTLLMQAFKKCRKSFYKADYSVLSCIDIANRYMTEGMENFYRYFGEPDQSWGYCFDDFGAENISVKYMGNELNCMEQIILSRYSRKIPFYRTHFTSNLDADAIERLYGLRVRSRLREMVNFIVIDGNDRRK